MGRLVNANRSEARLTPEQQAMAAEPGVIALARRMAIRKAKTSPVPLEDLCSAALLAVVEAARSFDSGRGVAFHRHASRRIEGAMKDLLRDEHLSGYGRSWLERNPGVDRPSVQSLDASIGLDGRRTIGDELASDDLPVGWEVDSLDAVESMIGTMPVECREAARLYFTNAGTRLMAEVAERFGVSSTTVKTRISRGLAAIRESDRWKVAADFL